VKTEVEFPQFCGQLKEGLKKSLSRTISAEKLVQVKNIGVF